MLTYDAEDVFSLDQALAVIGRAVQRALPERFWVVAEVAQMSASRGHVYLDLVQKEPASGALVAKARAMLWQSTARVALREFEAATGCALRAGMSALMSVSASCHAVYGLSLTVHAVDGGYTLGEMERRKRETTERLAREGLIDLNKDLALPPAPLRVAVVSSRHAAGYEDFRHQLAANAPGYRFAVTLFEAAVQGEQAERELVAAVHAARAVSERFDVLAVIRGGGSKTDLHGFDGYALARELATFPLPVVTGIGHERDDSAADLVAHTRCKTPTAAAELLVRRVADYEERLQEALTRVTRASLLRLESERSRLGVSARRLHAAAAGAAQSQEQALQLLRLRLDTAAGAHLERESAALERAADKIALLDPVNVLRRGYSLVYADGELIRAAAQLWDGQLVRLRFAGDAGATARVLRVDDEQP